VIGILAIRGFGFLILLSYKLRILMASVTALSLSPRAYALPTKLTYAVPTAATQNATHNVFLLNFPTDWLLDGSVIFLLMLILPVIVFTGFRKHKKKQFLHCLSFMA